MAYIQNPFSCYNRGLSPESTRALYSLPCSLPHYFERFLREYESRFEKEYGYFHPVIQEAAEKYPDRDRFEKESSFCILCGLCVRYCAEVKKKNAVGFVDCGARREIRFIPEIAAKECINCKECFELCPTSYLQAAFVLTNSHALSRDSSPTALKK